MESVEPLWVSCKASHRRCERVLEGKGELCWEEGVGKSHRAQVLHVVAPRRCGCWRALAVAACGCCGGPVVSFTVSCHVVVVVVVVVVTVRHAPHLDLRSRTWSDQSRLYIYIIQKSGSPGEY
jgi:hypothetical protein